MYGNNRASEPRVVQTSIYIATILTNKIAVGVYWLPDCLSSLYSGSMFFLVGGACCCIRRILGFGGASVAMSVILFVHVGVVIVQLALIVLLQWSI